ncbi:M28 family peptidase [Aquirufa rosea]|uniref:M28 family peptidase n=1 Tax=Aquirufa rosea TaxID=2509241 RepID=A0A4Q1BZF9_9BACT|nr:M28 family peptidase [Aquirufa rosea]RXK48913.1 M28 family peptidase [Aquirufa rosea]
MNRSKIALVLLVVFIASGLIFWFKSNKISTETSPSAVQLVETPNFSPDSAYAYVKQQVDFGPRVPGTVAHKNCQDWIIAKLKSYGLQVSTQPFTATNYEGKVLKGTNIMAQFQPGIGKRILLAAHWDSRAVADKDSVRKNEPIDAANDGASGVAVLIELARQLSSAQKKTTVGVDFLFFDLEDTGEPHGVETNVQNTWALGSQYWAAHIFPQNYRPYYGILLDMVGAKGAVFPQEYGSMQYAPSVVRSIWSAAEDLGFSSLFIQEEGPGITDDHTAVNEVAKIQMIDIIDLRPQAPGSMGDIFGPYHHTHRDNMSIIDPKTLYAVGQTLLQVLYRE